jgi:hypothetical protein
MDSPNAAPPARAATPGSVEQLITDEHFAIRAHLTGLRELATVFPELDQRAGTNSTFGSPTVNSTRPWTPCTVIAELA